MALKNLGGFVRKQRDDEMTRCNDTNNESHNNVTRT